MRKCASLGLRATLVTLLLALSIDADGYSQSATVVRAGAVAIGAVTAVVPPQIQIRSASGATAGCQPVSLELADADAPYQLMGATTEVCSKQMMATFDSLRLIPLGYVDGDLERLRLRIRVDDSVVGDLHVAVTLSRLAIANLGFPDTVTMGRPFAGRVGVTTLIQGGQWVPVRGAVVVARQQGGAVASARTDRQGIASLDGLIAQGAPAQIRIGLGVSSSVPVDGINAVQVTGIVGEPDHLSLSPVSGTRVGERIPAIRAMVFDAAGNPRADEPVDLSVTPGRLVLGSGPEMGVTKTGKDGAATWNGVAYSGPPGKATLTAAARSKSASVEFTVAPGPPNRLDVVQDPPARIIPESLFARPFQLRVLDTAGNALRGVPVTLTLCWLVDSAPRAPICREGPNSTADIHAPYLQGVVRRTTNDSGLVSFDSLSFVGRQHIYLLKATADGHWAFSAPLDYEPDYIYDRNLVAISAIKSVSGTKPSDEFFDLRFRFTLGHSLHVALHTDIALSRKSFSDSVEVTSPQRSIADASVALNWSPRGLRFRDQLTDAPDRIGFVGGEIRLFNTVPYLAFHFGSLELTKLFQGSMMTVGIARPLDKTPVTVDGVAFRPAGCNVVIDGFLRSADLNFFKYLNIRATVLIPVNAAGRRPTSRIVVSVPIGTLVSF